MHISSRSHLIDSQVSAGTISKSRTRSRMLRRVLITINAACLTGTQPGHCRSHFNPADAPSQVTIPQRPLPTASKEDISEAEDDDSDLRAGTTPAPLSTVAAFAFAHRSYRGGFLYVCIVLVSVLQGRASWSQHPAARYGRCGRLRVDWSQCGFPFRCIDADTPRLLAE